MTIRRVQDKSVARTLQMIFTAAGLLFLINIYFGFDNTLTVGEIPRWQALIHLHAGSIGWITLSAIGFMIWVMSGQRELDPAHSRRIRRLGWVASLVFLGYIPNFWLAFSQPDGPLVALLPLFGSMAVLVLWIAAVYAISQLRKQDPITPAAILMTGALTVAAIGATVGMLLGLERVIGQFLPLPQADRVGAHAGMMDTYLFLFAAAAVERVARKGLPAKASPFAWAQGLAWTVGATIVPVAFFLNMFMQLAPVFLLLLLLGLVIFLARVGWRALLLGPIGDRPRPWMFFGTVWLVVFMALFLYAIAAGDFSNLPTWFGAAFVHAGFVGMMTNLILGLIAVHAEPGAHVLAWGEPVSLWLINLGLALFLALKISADVRWGAAVMGVGVVLGVLTMLLRLRAGSIEPAAPGGSTAPR